MPVNIDGKPHLLGGFICTRSINSALESLQSGKKIRGTTVAVLGNRNRPPDMMQFQNMARLLPSRETE